jgi:catechol 2,3-dioxygenase-like lactoylglutathione lyase family enzyme
MTVTGAATIFTVSNLERSLGYYRDVLGFRVVFTYGEPRTYAGVAMDGLSLHLQAASTTWRSPGHGAAYVFASDVDDLHDRLYAAGARIVKPPETYAYGMRDFDVKDPDGNLLTFGAPAVPRDGPDTSEA